MSTLVLGSGPIRAASLRQVLSSRLKGWLLPTWQALESMGQRRAAAHMRQWAALHPLTHPELSAALRRAASSQG